MSRKDFKINKNEKDYLQNNEYEYNNLKIKSFKPLNQFGKISNKNSLIINESQRQSKNSLKI